MARLLDKARRQPPTLERAREWLAAAGQIEQAVLDSGGPGETSRVTDRIAAIFVALLHGDDASGDVRSLPDALSGVALPDAETEVRIPEGFAWYGLYPDSHAATAARWARAHPGASVAVIGLRSIGTALSAVVAAALRREGVRIEGRWTVRPKGHPFAREAEIELAIHGDCRAIIVDEGPGLSGSSMASVAEAVEAKGFASGRIVFFPGHGQGPGNRGGGREAGWWTPGRCWVSPAPPHPRQAAEWNWVFGGFAAATPDLATLAEVKRSRQVRLAAEGLALPSPAAEHGWIALSGRGAALALADLSPELMRGTLAPYLARAALAEEDGTTLPDASGRISAALAACGAGWAGMAGRVAAACRHLPLAGDGRMGPGEWLRLADGRVLKRNAMGSDCDHGWAGAQSMLWDVAGTMVEWKMRDEERQAWIGHMPLLRDVDPLALAFHEAGYCCLGLARAQHENDAVAAAHYGSGLRRAAEAIGALA